MTPEIVSQGTLFLFFFLLYAKEDITQIHKTLCPKQGFLKSIHRSLSEVGIWQLPQILFCQGRVSLEQSFLLTICLLNASHMSGTVLGVGDKALHKTNKVPILTDMRRREWVH
jgi:hypothetical protein